MKKVLVWITIFALLLTACPVAAAEKPAYAMDLDVSAREVYLKDGDYVNRNVDFSSGAETLAPGKVIYLLVATSEIEGNTIKDGQPPAKKLADLANFKLSWTAADGKEMIKSVKFAEEKTSATSKKLFIAVELNDKPILESQMVVMSIQVSAINGNAVQHNIEEGEAVPERNTAFWVQLKFNTAHTMLKQISNGYKTITGAVVATFAEDAEDVTLCFDKNIEYTNDMRKQKDIYLNMKITDDVLAEKYPNAELRLFTGTKDTFRQAGTMTIPYDSPNQAAYLYEADEKGVLTARSDAEFVDNQFVLKTATLGNYLLSGEKLTAQPEDTREPNPSTGGNGP